MTASMRLSSSTQTTSPTASSRRVTSALPDFATCSFAIAAVMPRPTCAGVLGIERTMALSSPMPAARLASVVPAAMERMIVPRPTRPLQTRQHVADDLRLDRDDDDLGLDRLRRGRQLLHPRGGEERRAVGRRLRIDDHHGLAVEAIVEPALEQGRTHLAGADQHQRTFRGKGRSKGHVARRPRYFEAATLVGRGAQTQACFACQRHCRGREYCPDLRCGGCRNGEGH